jgi:hypothetical protein
MGYECFPVRLALRETIATPSFLRLVTPDTRKGQTGTHGIYGHVDSTVTPIAVILLWDAVKGGVLLVGYRLTSPFLNGLNGQTQY